MFHASVKLYEESDGPKKNNDAAQEQQKKLKLKKKFGRLIEIDRIKSSSPYLDPVLSRAQINQMNSKPLVEKVNDMPEKIAKLVNPKNHVSELSALIAPIVNLEKKKAERVDEPLSPGLARLANSVAKKQAEIEEPQMPQEYDTELK
jgi:hypothetical protein